MNSGQHMVDGRWRFAKNVSRHVTASRERARSRGNNVALSVVVSTRERQRERERERIKPPFVCCFSRNLYIVPSLNLSQRPALLLAEHNLRGYLRLYTLRLGGLLVKPGAQRTVPSSSRGWLGVESRCRDEPAPFNLWKTYL